MSTKDFHAKLFRKAAVTVMFHVLLQFPSKGRRSTWLATLGAMIMTFTTQHPSVMLARRLEGLHDS